MKQKKIVIYKVTLLTNSTLKTLHSHKQILTKQRNKNVAL